VTADTEFTGQERDSETASSGMADGLDYFGARYFSAAQGRFTALRRNSWRRLEAEPFNGIGVCG